MDTVFDEWIQLWKKTMVAMGLPMKLIPDAEDKVELGRADISRRGKQE